jgi:ribosomal protein S18 acetylase RimI-like enzyme
MIIEQIENRKDFNVFEEVAADVYRGNKFYRGTEASIEKLLLNSKSAFQSHATIKKFVVRDGNILVARFALIQDHRLNDYCQVSYFEAQPGLGDIFSLIKSEVIKHFPQCTKVVVGLNGHLNYGAGILLNRFDEIPLFGLPYTPPYYPDYFSGLQRRNMFTFRFGMSAYEQWANGYKISREVKGLRVRFMDKKRIKEESAIYTQLNNLSFQNHPYWADRDEAEDLELFYPFRFLLDNENLIIAEVDGEPVGFFLWYPDFNQLVSSHRDLNLWDLIRFRAGKKIDTFRVTEIGVRPDYQRSAVALEMIRKSLPVLYEKGYRYCEIGFIFEENRASIAMLRRLFSRIYGICGGEYRHFATFETTLTK